MVWDLTIECKVYLNYVSILAGINNLFDEDYYARIRAGVIDPPADIITTRNSRCRFEPR